MTMEAMIDAAVHLGFPRDVATKLVITTIKGTAIYAQKSEDHAARLRNSVSIVDPPLLVDRSSVSTGHFSWWNYRRCFVRNGTWRIPYCHG
jgi:hypothetical protein